MWSCHKSNDQCRGFSAMCSILLFIALPSLVSGFIRGSRRVPASKERLGIERPRNGTCPPQYSVFDIDLFSFINEEEQALLEMGSGEHCSPILSLWSSGPSLSRGGSCETAHAHHHFGTELCLHRDCWYELRLETDNLTKTASSLVTNDCSFVDSVVKVKLDRTVVWEKILPSEDLDFVLTLRVGSNQTTTETSLTKGPQTVGDHHSLLSHRHDARQLVVARRFLQVGSVRIFYCFLQCRPNSSISPPSANPSMLPLELRRLHQRSCSFFVRFLCGGCIHN